jgi:hypothetical protein
MERKLWSRLHSPALSILGAASAAAGTDRDRGNRELGNVVPCSLVIPVIAPRFLAMPAPPTHMASSDRGMALGATRLSSLTAR